MANRRRVYLITNSTFFYLLVWVTFCGNKMYDGVVGYKESELDSLFIGQALLVYQAQFPSYSIFYQGRDHKFVKNSYRCNEVNEFGKENYYSIAVGGDLKKGKAEALIHDDCQPNSEHNVDILKARYSSDSRFWDFYYKENNFYSNIVINDTLYLLFKTNDPDLISWFRKNRKNFVLQLNEKH